MNVRTSGNTKGKPYPHTNLIPSTQATSFSGMSGHGRNHVTVICNEMVILKDPSKTKPSSRKAIIMQALRGGRYVVYVIESRVKLIVWRREFNAMRGHPKSPLAVE